ncbi:MAG: 1-deoxy-D-xylulose-5-phosphate reductoisomerase [Acetivibrionales bacterium]|jgi:1-deoxy-D-xylulose-5-phosphate reductoisomerase|nr:1-deoxy-D-xylulose-5-phosphate reductoisomerase [Clostridiaceae bacterium]
MIKGLSILGSTGSIGTQALEVCDNLNIKVVSLVANSNVRVIEEQIRRFKPEVAALYNEKAARELRLAVKDTDTRILEGSDGVLEAVTYSQADTVLTSVVGTAGLLPTISAIEAGKNIALSNKETLVTAGKIITDLVRKKGVKLFPVDSEHSAIFQCIAGNRDRDISRLILTASGGPFRGYSRQALKSVTVKEALNHPNWSMGSKITIDSATMMNKGLEVIEAMWLFDIPVSQIDIVVHPQSIIHSMVEFNDGSVMAQMGAPDMRIPIQLALTWPERISNSFNKIDFDKLSCLNFEKPDYNTFEALKLAKEAAETGGTMPCAMNAANEVAVELFLEEKISFLEITEVIKLVMKNHIVNTEPVLNDIIDTDRASRELARSFCDGGC